MDETPCRIPPDRERNEALERELLTLSAHIDAATWRFLALVAEFDSARGWSGDGICSCAHWLNWKCGIGMSAAHDKVRVAHALPRLPKISEALRTGEVSYSKVRAMTRAAAPENEDYLLELARHGTASHMERIVRGYRRSTGDAEAALANARHRARTVSYYRDPNDGSIVIEARLPPELGERVITAIESAIEVLEADASASTACDDLPSAAADDPHAQRAVEMLAARPPLGGRYAAVDAEDGDGASRHSTHEGVEAAGEHSAEDGGGNADLDIDEHTNRCLWNDVRVDLGMAVSALIHREPHPGAAASRAPPPDPRH